LLQRIWGCAFSLPSPKILFLPFAKTLSLFPGHHYFSLSPLLKLFISLTALSLYPWPSFSLPLSIILLFSLG
jgi:hypothetical protein